MADDVRNIRASCRNQIEIGAAKLLILSDELRVFMSMLFLLAQRGFHKIMQIGGIGEAIGLRAIWGTVRQEFGKELLYVFLLV